MGFQIRIADEADTDGIAAVSISAFSPDTDVIARTLFPPSLRTPRSDEGHDLRQWTVVRKSARLHSPGSVVTVAVDDALGKVVGYSVWFLPVTDEDGEQVPKPRPQFPGMDQTAFAELRGLLMRDEIEIFGERGTKDVWTLDSLGVDPEYQRRGIGRMLLNWGVERAENQGRECFLVATPSGAPLYLANGFHQVKTTDIFGVPHICMRNRPQ